MIVKCEASNRNGSIGAILPERDELFYEIFKISWYEQIFEEFSRMMTELRNIRVR